MLWIDTNATDPHASVLDVEPGDATPAAAAHWAHRKLRAQPHALARIYTMRSEWAAVRVAVGELPSPMRSYVRWWIADPTGIPHIVPDADATQWYWALLKPMSGRARSQVPHCMRPVVLGEDAIAAQVS